MNVIDAWFGIKPLWSMIKRTWFFLRRHAELATHLGGFLAAAFYVAWRLSSEGTKWEHVFKAFSEAAFPVLVVLILRDFFRYHRHGEVLEDLADVLSLPETKPSIGRYIHGIYFEAGERVRGLLSTSGVELDVQKKYELACFLLQHESEQRVLKKCYRATNEE